MKITSLLLPLLAFAVLAGAAPKKELSDFEKSLIGGASAETQSGEASASESDSTGSSLNEFEQSLATVPSEYEDVYKLRESMLEAVKSKNTTVVGQLADELAQKETRSLIPLKDFESEVIYLDLRMYDRLLDMLVKHYRNLLDTTRYDENPKVIEDDGLFLYVVNRLESRDKERNVYYSVAAQIEGSNLSDEKKRKLEMFLLLRDAYRSDDVGVRVRDLAQSVTNGKDDPESRWIAKSILSPLTRMNMFAYNLEKRAENKEEIIKGKLYTGGFGMNLFFLSGGMAFGMDDLYRSDLFEPEETSINLEFYLQIKRFAISGELLASGITGVNSYSLGLGYVAYDSRYLKVRPYVGLGMPAMILEAKERVYGSLHGEGESEGMGEGNSEMYTESLGLTLAVNVDFKFATLFLFSSSSKFFSPSIVGKFGVSYINFEDTFVYGSGVSPFFSLGLGMYLW